jgi:hypothetical protein
MVRFFDGGLGIFSGGRGKTKRSEMMEVCANGFAEAPERLFYWQWKCIGSNEWLPCIDENTKRRGFFLGREGFFH